MSENGFKVNTDVKVMAKKRRSKRAAQRTLLLGVAVILLLGILAIIFCASVPVKKETVLDYRTVDFGDGNIQTDYYDEEGNIIKNVYSYFGEENGYTEITYDKKGNPLKETSTFQGVLATVRNYVYSEGRLVKAENLTADNVVTDYTEYAYNPDGTVTMELLYDSEGVITAQYNYTYEAGVKVKTSVLYLSSNYSEEITYVYDRGNVVKETRTSERTERVTDYTYDNVGNVLTKRVDSGEYAIYKYTYKTVKVPVFG